MLFLRSLTAPLFVALVLVSLSLACTPTASPTPASPTADAFAVVRSTAEAAYASGKTHLAHGEFLQACVDLDLARTNDPDNRAEIQQALEQALGFCLTPLPEATAAPAPASPRTIVVATVPPLVGRPTALGATPTPPASAIQSVTPAGSAASPAAATVGGGAMNVSAFTDPQGRFSMGAPPDWTRIDNPQTLFGNGVVAFHDPTARAQVDVAVDSATNAVSPELYSASIELAMQQQVPGYASEQVQPGTTSGSPSLRRVFTFTQRDATGQEHQARGFQVTVVKGSVPYIISGSAPADQYQQYSSTFDQMVQSFRFR